MPAPEPVSALRAAGAAALVGLVLIGCVTGLGRYLTARDHQMAQLAELAGMADDVARLGPAVSVEQARSGLARDADGLDVVLVGQADAFGIARGARLAISHRAATATPSPPTSAEALQVRMAAISEATVLSPRLRFAADELPGGTLLAAFAPLSEPGGAHAGLVRVSSWQTQAEDPIPWWRWLLGVLLVAIAGALLRAASAGQRAVGGSLATGCVVVGVALGCGAEFGLVSACVVMPFAWLAVNPVAELMRGLKDQPATYLYVLPAVVATVVLVFIPFSMGVVLAFFDARGAPVGLANFREILVTSETADTNFWWTFGMTVVWTVTNIVLHVSIGLALAMVLNRPRLELRWLYRVLLIVPWAVPNYITALIWKGLFNEHEGAVNAALAVFGVGAIDWFGTGVLTNFTANLVTNVWLGFPFMMVVCLGALQAIPRELYEAATIDGAGRLQAFRHVTVPLLKPALVPAIIVGTIWTFNMFNVIYLVSGGGPDGQTDILITEAYHAFKVLKRYGLAAAYSLLIFAVLFAYGAMTNRITRASEGAFE